MSDFPFQGKKILDVTCGSRSIWFDKHHPAALYCDIREENDTFLWASNDGRSEQLLNVKPDIMRLYKSSFSKRFIFTCCL